MKATDKPQDNSKVAAVVLAAGEGKRMKSDIPKVLHEICGRPSLRYVLDEVEGLGPGVVLLVAGHGADAVSAEAGPGVRCVIQSEQNGTGHAVMVAMEGLGPEFDEILVLPGDSPLVRGSTLESLLEARREDGAGASVLTVRMDDPTGYGRVVRNDKGMVERIVEEADASVEERGIAEVNACTYVFCRARLQRPLSSLDTDNAQGEYYLTDVVEAMVAGGDVVVPVRGAEEESLGVNDREHLAAAGAVMRRRINGRLMAGGVTMTDPEKIYVDYGVDVGRDTVIMPMVFITGATRIGRGCLVGPCSAINDSAIGDRCVVEYSWLDGCELSRDVNIGPFSRLRPGCKIGAGSKVGSFVEMKKVVVGAGSKIPHLSYMGDAVIGNGVNVGAGSITCNYDGEEKHITEIGDRAFLGSDTMLIAPVRIGEDAATGAGSSIYQDVPDGNLGIERNTQKNVPDWRERKKGGRGREKGPRADD
ncbi:MAG: bifunctional UDP-N-acetylglucosamine diphosphorylase/glucosamine-1-phosphate N-acetyltransferase GlmU [Actinobacteria bacterium]|nr:bifunctional UDP-N-acetylglucosamine diphosphorylase/glucosamine-1-phosphate N-acetyltransferase GlmU [Actinomycetota bacterium]MBU4489032.1 bifunctional UDP-N-acetylglucosamine diphosphorylase/glucosamine-1-phosphate N-acetyltransferase GlmU [Actinomycetota bacterium]